MTLFRICNRQISATLSFVHRTMSKRRGGKQTSKSVSLLDENISSQCLRCCFICDKPVKNSGVQIIFGRTPFSNVGLPAKIGQLIGENFMVVVGESDKICSRCASLINQLDKLETDAHTVKKTLTGYIAVKYQLNHKEICAKVDYVEGEVESHEKVNKNSSDNVRQVPRESKKKVQQVSLLATNKTNKPIAISCENCNFWTTDKDALRIHSALCLKQTCFQCGDHIGNHHEQLYSYAGTCSICSESFDSEDQYTKHMLSHTNGNDKCIACHFMNSQNNELLCHVLSHGLQVFQCSICEVTVNVKLAWEEHMRSHRAPDKCLKCSVGPTSQIKTENGIAQCLSEDDTSNEVQVESKGKLANEYMESLMRTDGFDTDGCNIEFHSCPSCGLTFLNKILFSEHIKMHDENQTQYHVTINNQQDEVLKNSAVSVTGDCSIDDDLEDLFEKLHAETTSSTLAGQNHIVGNNNQIINGKTSPENLSFSASMKTFCAASEDTITPISKLVSNTNDTTSEMDQDSMGTTIGSVAYSSFNTSIVGKHVTGIDQGFSNDMLDSSEQQTIVYAIPSGENGLADFDPQNAIIVQTSIDPDSGNLQYLPYLIDNAVSSSQLLPSTVLENDMDCSGKSDILEENFEKPKHEPDLISDAPADVLSANTGTYSCDFCSFQTSIELVLKRHLKVHQGNMVRKCSICNRVFSSTQRLLSHINLHHKDAGSVSCPLCSEDFVSSALLRDHLAEAHPVGKQNFPCRFCPKKFTSRKLCTIHEEGHSEIFKFHCEICVKRFTTEDDLDDHVKWDHNKSGQCRYCGKKIDKAKALKHHELRHMQESSHHECPDCKRVFKTKTGLRHHAATHTGQFKFCCDFCGRGFMSRMMLEEHRSCHTKEERYVCDICGQKFSFQSTYWIHKKWHETPFPYKCNFCDRFFKHSSLLAVHKRKHTGERPYKCPHCPLTFPVSGTLKRHIILHTGVYPFNCDACKRGFTARHKYASHLEKVHGAKEPVSNDLKLDTPNLINNSVPENVKGWDLDYISLEENTERFTMSEESTVGNGDPLISDRNVTSRVVEIVYGDSYQPVASVVTLGGSDSIIPENWYV